MAKKRVSKKQNQQSKISIGDIVVATLLLMVVAIMPLIVRYATPRMPPELVVHFGQGVGVYVDIFSYFKSWFVLLPAGLIVLFFISEYFVQNKKQTMDIKAILKNPVIVLSAIYLLFVLISAIFSSYTYTSFIGTVTRREGVFVWFAYFVMFFTAMYFVRETKHATWIICGLAFSSILMGLVGVSQIFENGDFLGTEFAAPFIVGRDMFARLQAEHPDFTRMTTEFEISYGTLFNPNTFGKYTAMVSPILLLAALTYRGKIYINIAFLVGGLLMMVGIFASGSLGGLIGIATSVGVLLVVVIVRFVYTKIKFERESIDIRNILIKYVAPIFAVVFAIVLALIFVPTLNSRVTRLYNRLGVAMRAETTQGYGYVFDMDKVNIYRAGERIFTVQVHEGLTPHTPLGLWLTVFDGDSNIVPMANVESPAVLIYEIPGYRTIRLQQYSDSFMIDSRHGFVLSFRNGKIYGRSVSGLSGADTTGGWIDMSVSVSAWGFYGRETWGSNRGYIWSRTFPLMPRTAIIGTGPDTFFSGVFPWHDIIGRQISFGNPYIKVDKAHNLFLQTWITTGGISAIALFLLFGHYLLTTFRGLVTSKNNKNNREDIFGFGLRLGLLAGIAAFVMSSNATDSTIGSTGVFFVLLGIGYGLNAVVKRMEDVKKAT